MAAFYLLPSIALAMVAPMMPPGQPWTTRGWLDATIGVVAPTNRPAVASPVPPPYSEPSAAAVPPASLDLDEGPSSPISSRPTNLNDEWAGVESPVPTDEPLNPNDEPTSASDTADVSLDEEASSASSSDPMDPMDTDGAAAIKTDPSSRNWPNTENGKVLSLLDMVFASLSLKLSKAEVVSLLNTVPTFNVVDANERVMSTWDMQGREAVRFYLDPAEAKKSMLVAQAIRPTTTLHLSVTMLGTAYALAEGWAKSPYELPMRIQGSQSLIAAVAKHSAKWADHREAETDDLSSGCGIVPIFASDALQSPSLTPFFLHPKDFVATWVAAGLPEDKVPPELTVTSLKKLVELMLTGTPDGRDWRTSMIIAGEQTAAFALQCHEETQERHKQRVVMRMMHAAGITMKKAHHPEAETAEGAEEEEEEAYALAEDYHPDEAVDDEEEWAEEVDDGEEDARGSSFR